MTERVEKVCFHSKAGRNFAPAGLGLGLGSATEAAACNDAQQDFYTFVTHNVCVWESSCRRVFSPLKGSYTSQA